MNITKRVISTILCLVMLLSAFPMTDISEIFPKIVASAEGEIYYGDVNENGRVEASDARLILQKSASLKTFTDRQMQLADCNQDGKVTAVDARTTLRTAAKLEDPIIFESAEIITQGDYIKDLMGELGLGGTGTAEQFFDNVTPEDDCFEAVQAAVEWGILDPDSDFDPDKEATVDFAVSAAENALQYDNIPEDAELIDDNTDKKDDCNTDIAKEIIEKAKDYRLNEEPEEEFESIEIKETVETFDASEITAESEDTFTFNSFGDEIPEVGDVFITETENGQTAEKIVSVTDNGDGTYTTETVQPDMDEVFDDFSFVETATPDVDEISFTPAAGVFTTDSEDDFEMLAEGRKKDEDKDVFELILELNSNNTPGMLPDMCCKLSSDYVEALNMATENKDVPSAKKILEEYNQQIEILSGNDGKNTVETTPVKKYDSGWTFNVELKLSNFEVDFNFKDFWETGNYEISFLADVTELINFEGTFSAEKHLGTLHFSHGIQKIFFNVDIDVYAYIDINGKVTISGSGKIVQTYGNYDGRTDTLNNNAFTPHLDANVDAEAGIEFSPAISTLGFELAEVGIQIGLNGAATVSAVPLVDYNNTLYYYAGDVLTPPEELDTVIFGCLTLELNYPIIRISVSAGEDVKKQIEKWKKKGKDIPNIPLEHTFKICTLDKDSMLTPISNSVHFELHKGAEIVKECTAESYDTLAHMCSGYVVKKGTDEVIANATVQLLDKDNKVVSSATTNLNGEFDLKFIPYGEYSVKIISDGAEATLDKKVTIDKNESNIGKLEFETDPLMIYVDFLKKQGKTITSNGEYGGTIGQTRKYTFSDAILCNLDTTSDYPELVVCYSSDFIYTAYRIYSIKNSKVSMEKEFIDVTGVSSRGCMKIWNDPYLNGHYLLYYRQDAGTMHYGSDYKNIYPYEIDIASIHGSYDHSSQSMKETKFFSPSYKKYLESASQTALAEKIQKYVVYEFKNSASNKIRIAVIDDNGKCTTKTFSF